MADSTGVLNAPPPGDNPFANLMARFKALPQKNRIGIMVGVPFLIALLASLFMWANQASYRVLFNGLSDQDGGAIVETLNQMKVPYKFNSTGTAILVPSDQVYNTRLELASKGLPKGTTSGFEALDNQKLGITQFQEQVNYQRALEGELVRSIESISAVQSARVHLAIPKPSIFIRERQQPSASVVLDVYGGRILNESQIQGIVHLVSSSIPGMSPDHVSVVDQTGRLLTQQDSDIAGLNPTQLAYTNQIENSLSDRIVNILSPVFGRDNVRATVTADVDFSTSQRTDEIYKPNSDPKNATIRSQQMSESTNGSSANPSGVPGTMSNQPPGNATAPIGADPQANLANKNGSSQQTDSSMHKDSTVNYEVDKTTHFVKDQVGKVKRLTAAVVLNYKTITDKKGDTRQVPLTPEEMKQVDELVKQAMGFDTQRGDAVNVVNQEFTKPATVDVPLWKQPQTMDLLQSMGMPLGIALVAAILVFGIFKPLFRTVTVEPFDEGPELLPGQKGRVPLLPNGEGNDMELLEQLQREGTVPGVNRHEKLDRLRSLAKDHPQVVAAIVRNWVNGEAQQGA